VEAYIHGGGRIGALVEVNCETDFVARTEAFRTLARDIAMQVAAMNPAALRPEDVPGDLPGEAKDHALLTQTFIKDASRNIEQLIQDVIAQTGENVRVTRFSRFELGGA
jgi:elongation factor Ts